MARPIEIRLHGRGGQGGVTCAKIIAACYAALGKSVQTFGDYAGERSGAPVRAYTRVGDEPVTNRNKVYEPDHLVVLDPHLLGPEVFAGAVPAAKVLLNTPLPMAAFADRYREFVLAIVDATRIARAHKIGSRSVVIVNTTIAGAYARMHSIPLEVLRQTYARLGFLGNFPAAQEAYDAVQIRLDVPTAPAAAAAVGTRARPEVVPVTAHAQSPAPGLETGNWSSQRPQYVEHLAPCSAWCPAGNDVVGFVQSMVTDDPVRGAEILGRTTPLAAVCGRVCPAPCMAGCNRAEYDGSVDIRGLERRIADSRPVAVQTPAIHEDPRRIAIVGGGPAGLSAAYSLAVSGHRVTLMEGERSLGGVLRTGIPSYRLPREVLDREVGGITALGIEVRSGRFLRADEIAALAGAYDAVILATGLQKLRGLQVPGSSLAGVQQGIHFLHDINLRGNVARSGHIVVLGGGNTAMDCARSALRAGAARVTVAYRRTRAEMPAIPEEVEEALEEGIELLEQRTPVGFSGDGRVQEVTLAVVEMGPPDASGRREPKVTDRTERLACDGVLLALGQSADLSLLPTGWEVHGSQVQAAGQPLPVFVAGDLATGDGTVTHAIGSGRRVAGIALRALGLAVPVFERPDRAAAVPATDIRFDHFARRSPERGVTVPAAARRHTFAEVNGGLATAAEAHRCFACGHCTRCDTCLVYCPEGIIRRQAPGYEVDYTYCKGCGICVEECPRQAMEMLES